MSFKAAKFLVMGTAFCLACSAACAQEVVHAVTGVVTKVDSATHTITLTTNDGSQMVLQDETGSHSSYAFDKALQSKSMASTAFDKTGNRAVVYYFGDGTQRRAVAVEDLGPAPLKASSGQITHWDHHHHTVTIKAADGSKQSFQLDDATVVDTPMGVVNGDKFDGQNGDQISIRYMDKGGANQAVFLSES